jgi:hypothetical protein
MPLSVLRESTERREGRRKKEEGRRKKEEGRRKKEEGKKKERRRKERRRTRMVWQQRGRIRMTQEREDVWSRR